MPKYVHNGNKRENNNILMLPVKYHPTSLKNILGSFLHLLNLAISIRIYSYPINTVLFRYEAMINEL